MEPEERDGRNGEVIQGEVGAEILPPDDPQVAVALAINDVIELARAMSRQKLGRGEIEMRRRLAVMDKAIEIAERASAPVEGNA